MPDDPSRIVILSAAASVSRGFQNLDDRPKQHPSLVISFYAGRSRPFVPPSKVPTFPEQDEQARTHLTIAAVLGPRLRTSEFRTWL